MPDAAHVRNSLMFRITCLFSYWGKALVTSGLPVNQMNPLPPQTEVTGIPLLTWARHTGMVPSLFTMMGTSDAGTDLAAVLLIKLVNTKVKCPGF